MPEERPEHSHAWEAEQFERARPQLLAVAYRMLGSLSEAEDAVQEAWVRLTRAREANIDNLAAWLTTVVGRVSIDMLRARHARRQEPYELYVPDPIIAAADGVDPEREALIADSVGLALLIVLDTLAPAERLAFVLHDIFDVPFDQIAPIIDRSPQATRQIASRARRRVRTTQPPEMDIGSQWRLVDAFLAAARDGDFGALLDVLDPDVIRRVDAGPAGPEVPPILRGAHAVASGARAFARLGHREQRALVNGAPGIVTLVDGRPYTVLGFTFAHGRITEINVLADPERLRKLDLTSLIG
ncbi:MAG TPA: sigma-70 family RNA polymerase sigma factor [Solirubrobacteraceae bacterium]|nr:sigma-70 family RNA polymerase sigma factor [Solirubrobacteraceae bacterium]